MQELVGRLTALDPEASETLKVVSYFDALVRGGVGVEGLLRGAAALAGAVAGAELRGRMRRRDASGAVPPDDADAPRTLTRAVPGGEVWLERRDAAHANDDMVIERLALAVELITARRHEDGALEIAIDAARSPADRSAALARLNVDPSTRVRVSALSAELPVADARSTLVATPRGIVRAVLDDGSRAWAGPGGRGTVVRAEQLPESWEAALVALRLTDAAHPVVDAADLGALVLLAQAYDPAQPPDDVVALSRFDARTREVLSAVVESESLRSAAAALGMHHSTVQARHESLLRDLGYDPRSAMGRARYIAADLLLRLDRDSVAGT
ncbi:hypothetical protein [Microbacterium sp. NPDC091662]|uniref:hypothetical protein n=1 Tax=Microbacterium sp. NPDC091662 TaxID=3364211 RepID=UPI0038169719